MNAEMNAFGIDKVAHYKWTSKGDCGQLAYVPKAVLHIDPAYQRNATHTKVLRIAKEWNWMALGAITVSERDGVLFVVDGQHRVLAAKKRSDVQELPCIIFKSSGARDEAKGFVEANTNRKAVVIKDRHDAMLMYGDPIATHVQSLLDRGGKVVASGSKQPDSIQAIGVLHKLAKSSPDELEALWPTLCEITRGKYMHERLIDGLVWVEKNLKEGQSLADPKWQKRIESVGSDALIRGAGEGAAFFSKGGAKAWGLGMVQVINKGLRHRLEVKA